MCIYINICLHICIYICIYIYVNINIVYVYICLHIGLGGPILFASVFINTNCTMQCCRLAASTTYIYGFKSTKKHQDIPMLMGETPCSQIFPSSNHHLYHPQPLRVGIAHDLPTHQTETIIGQTHLYFLVFYPCINAFDCIQYVSCFLPCGEMDIKLATGRPPRNRKFKMVEPNHLGSLNGISVTWAGNMSIFGMFIT